LIGAEKLNRICYILPDFHGPSHGNHTVLPVLPAVRSPEDSHDISADFAHIVILQETTAQGYLSPAS